MKLTPDDKLKWYIINCYSGHEKKVAQQLTQRVNANQKQEEIAEVLVPTQEKITVKEGKKRLVEEKVYPGYVLIKMKMSDDNWNLVRNTEGVKGFVGIGSKPTPLSEDKVNATIAYTKVKQPSFSANFSVGDAVKVVDGPFVDLVGSIVEINEAKGQVKVLLNIFGRETPVFLDFLQVNRL